MRPGAREAERRAAARIVEPLPLLLQPAPMLRDSRRRYPASLSAVRPSGSNVSVLPAMIPSAQNTTNGPGALELLAVAIRVGDIPSEAAGVVAKEHLELAGLGVGEHPSQVGPPERVLAADEIDVFEGWGGGAMPRGPSVSARRAGWRGRSGRPGRASILGGTPPTGGRRAPRGADGLARSTFLSLSSATHAVEDVARHRVEHAGPPLVGVRPHRVSSTAARRRSGGMDRAPARRRSRP